MAKLTPPQKKIRGKISSQTKTSRRVGRFRRQRVRTTVKKRKQIKRRIRRSVDWVW